jgi:hypothetical protein
MKPPSKACVSKVAGRKFAIKPRSMTVVHRTAPESVPDKESHPIRAGQMPEADAVVGN